MHADFDVGCWALGRWAFPALPVTRLSRRLLAKAFGVALAKAGHSSLAHSPVFSAHSPRSRKPIQRAMHIHPTVSELIPTMLGELKPLK